ncbi:uncharacterized protein J3R85_020562 [Psidium guajava]|nr:uncharacterized protein J3R85_020562 [Psidium guajava]
MTAPSVHPRAPPSLLIQKEKKTCSDSRRPRSLRPPEATLPPPSFSLSSRFRFLIAPSDRRCRGFSRRSSCRAELVGNGRLGPGGDRGGAVRAAAAGAPVPVARAPPDSGLRETEDQRQVHRRPHPHLLHPLHRPLPRRSRPCLRRLISTW